MMEDRARYPEVAQADLRAAYEGLPVTAEQQRILTWMETWDQPTLNAIADVIRTARAS